MLVQRTERALIVHLSAPPGVTCSSSVGVCLLSSTAMKLVSIVSSNLNSYFVESVGFFFFLNMDN